MKTRKNKDINPYSVRGMLADKWVRLMFATCGVSVALYIVALVMEVVT